MEIKIKQTYILTRQNTDSYVDEGVSDRVFRKMMIATGKARLFIE
jgi:hypothetical protein